MVKIISLCYGTFFSLAVIAQTASAKPSHNTSVADPSPTTNLPTAQTVIEISKERSVSSILPESVLPSIPVESWSFQSGISTHAKDLLPNEIQASDFITAQTAPLLEDSTTPGQSNPAEPTEEIPQNDSTEAAESVEELARKAQNPIANLISLPFQNNTNFGVGSLDRTQNILNIQPVIPVSLSDDLLLITRTIVPIIYQPEPPTGGGGTFGLGDINPQFYFSPKTSSNITWGVGPTFLLPTATSEVLRQEKWGIGPAAVIVVTAKKFVFGVVANNIWSVAGDSDRPNVSQLTFQPFINYNMKDGWYLVSAPILTANWENSEGNQWTVPLGGGFGRIFAIDKQKVNAQLQVYWNTVKPDNGPDWTLRAQFQFLFPQ
jgi:hypothetical protein